MKQRVSVKERVDELVAEHGTYRAAGEAVGIDFSVLHRVAHGKKGVGKVILRRLGLDFKSATFTRLTS